MKVAIYIRVSTQEQLDKGYSIGEQTDLLKAYAKSRRWTIHDIYVDGGRSGLNTDRPALQSMLLDAELGRFDSVLVWQLDRLGRNQRDILNVIHDLMEHKVQFICIEEGIDTNSESGTLMIGIMSTIAQMEVERLKERLKRGLIGRAKSGKPMAWSFDTFGYDYIDSKYIINPAEAEIVRYMFDYYGNVNPSITALMDDLNNQGHIGKDKPWSRRSVRVVLRNSVYIGKINYLGEEYEGVHESIISVELFNKVQDTLKDAQRAAQNTRRYESRYMLSSIIRCGHCGARMELRRGRIRKDGSFYQFYHCATRRKRFREDYGYPADHKCPIEQEHAYLQDIEGYVIAEMEKIRLNPEMIKYNVVDNTRQIEAFKQEIDNLSAKLDRATDLYIDGMLSKEKLADHSDKINHQIDSLSRSILELETNSDKKSEEAAEILHNLKQNVMSLPYKERNKLAKSLIDKVEIYTDRIDIYWFFDV